MLKQYLKLLGSLQTLDKIHFNFNFNLLVLRFKIVRLRLTELDVKVFELKC